MTLTINHKIGVGIVVFIVVMLPILCYTDETFGKLGEGGSLLLMFAWCACIILLGTVIQSETEPKTDKIKRLIEKINQIHNQSQWMDFHGDRTLETAFKMHLACEIKPIQDELVLLMPSYYSPAPDAVGKSY